MYTQITELACASKKHISLTDGRHCFPQRSVRPKYFLASAHFKNSTMP